MTSCCHRSITVRGRLRITPEGKVKPDQGKVSARRDGQVKAVLDNGAFAPIVLGWSHDLSDSVRRVGNPIWRMWGFLFSPEAPGFEQQ